MRLLIKRLRSDAHVPSYATAGSAGLDLTAALDAPITLEPGQHVAVPTGIAIALPPNTEGQVRPRSGLAARHGVTVLNAPGTIDEDYRGELRVLLINHGQEPFVIEGGHRIAQLVVTPICRVACDTVTELDDTVRGGGGFGSTGLGNP